MDEMNCTEVWKQIPGLKHYESSSLGNIRMLGHNEETRNRWGDMVRFRRGRILRKFKRNNGYLCVSILNKPFSVHRAVALAFHGVPGDKLVVNHKNGIKTDNRPENLEWVTVSQNETHSYKVLGKVPWNKGVFTPELNEKRLYQRRINYMNKCIDVWNTYNSSNFTIKELAEQGSVWPETISHMIKCVEKVIGGNNGKE